MTPFLRVMQTREKEKEEEVFTVERCKDLKGLDEKREKAQEQRTTCAKSGRLCQVSPDKTT